MPPRVVLDACVLAPFPLFDTLLRLADSGVVAVFWSPLILAEVERTLVRDLGRTESEARKRIAYTSGVNRAMLTARGIKTVIPQKKDEKDEIAARKRKGSAGGRPPAFDADVYKGRNVVERNSSHTKQWRGIATRYGKLAITYRAATVLQACIRWSKLLGDMP